jgi:hypothetical protein
MRLAIIGREVRRSVLAKASPDRTEREDHNPQNRLAARRSVNPGTVYRPL